ncbi:unnamed protein product, partial [Pylaiella littoralis]
MGTGDGTGAVVPSAFAAPVTPLEWLRATYIVAAMLNTMKEFPKLELCTSSATDYVFHSIRLNKFSIRLSKVKPCQRKTYRYIVSFSRAQDCTRFSLKAHQQLSVAPLALL